MTVKRLIAIMFIFVCTLIAWMILGAVNLKRTDDSWTQLHQEVRSLYGDALTIKAPALQHETMVPYQVLDNGVQQTRYNKKTMDVSLASQQVHIDLHQDQRRKGTLWFPTFKADFKARYVFAIPQTLLHENLLLYASLGNSNAIYRDIRVTINGKRLSDLSPLLKNAPVDVTPSEREMVLEISYRTTGMGSIGYLISPDYGTVRQIKKLDLNINTDFEAYDFLADTLSPTVKRKKSDGYELSWHLTNAITGKDIGVEIPNRLNPGEILSRVTFFAPVPLLFFFFIVMIVSIIKKIPIHPMHYFFLATSFFSFHLIFSYYSDLMNIYAAFAIASVVSLLLTSTYLRLFTPGFFAFVVAPTAQLIYLIIFSFTFFFKGISGMIGATFAVLTLAVIMQLTGKLDWEKVFSPNRN